MSFLQGPAHEPREGPSPGIAHLGSSQSTSQTDTTAWTDTHHLYKHTPASSRCLLSAHLPQTLLSFMLCLHFSSSVFDPFPKPWRPEHALTTKYTRL